MKLTEDQTIIFLIAHLEKNAWHIKSHCLGIEKGCDIVAVREGQNLLIEVKGARANDNAPNKRRDFFSNGQIKTHFGKAIVKILDDKYLHPQSNFAIAHPDDPQIKKAIGKLTPFLKTLNISHFWVAENGDVTVD